MSLEEVPLNPVGQRGRGWQDTRSPNQGGAQPQDDGEEAMKDTPPDSAYLPRVTLWIHSDSAENDHGYFGHLVRSKRRD